MAPSSAVCHIRNVPAVCFPSELHKGGRDKQTEGVLVPICMYSQKWMLEWLKMSACTSVLLKSWGDSTIATSSPSSIMGSVLMKNIGIATCQPRALQSSIPEVLTLARIKAFAESQFFCSICLNIHARGIVVHRCIIAGSNELRRPATRPGCMEMEP